MKRKALVVYKKSAYEVYALEKKDPRFLSLLERGDPSVSRIQSSHEAHIATMDTVRRVCEDFELKLDWSYRSEPFHEEAYDLIMSLGGDGTFLETSHRVVQKPILGINSNPEGSIGFFCGAMKENFREVLQSHLKGDLEEHSLSRLQVSIQGRKLPIHVLNDVLITHKNPAATFRYLLELGGVQEEQKSSGVWISSAAGSTAAILSAGGKVMPLESEDFQYLPRELFRFGKTVVKHQGGRLKKSEKFFLISKMRNGIVFFDGPHLSAPFGFGDRLEITSNGPKLRALGLRIERRNLSEKGS